MNVEVGPLFALLVLLGLIGAGWVAFRVSRKFPAVSYGLFLFYAAVSIFISLLYLETHAVFISEASASSEAIGATFRFALLHVAVLLGIAMILVIRPQTTEVAVPKRAEVKGATYLLVAVVGAQLLNLALSRSTAFPWGQASRFDFWEHYAFLPLLETLFGTFSIFVPFMASALYVYASENRWLRIKRISLATLFGYFIYLLGSGQVFHGLFVPATIIAGTYMIWRISKKKAILSPRGLAVVLLFGVIASALAISSIGQRSIARGSSGTEATAYRLLVMQGGVIWRADDIRQRGYEGSYRRLLEGRDFLLRTILPPNLAKQYEEKGVNLQGALPSTAYLAVGLLPALAICFLYGLLCGAVMKLMTWLFLSGQLLLMFVASFLWLWVIVAYSRGSLETIISPSFAVGLIIVVTWIIVDPLTRKRPRSRRLMRRVRSIQRQDSAKASE